MMVILVTKVTAMMLLISTISFQLLAKRLEFNTFEQVQKKSHNCDDDHHSLRSLASIPSMKKNHNNADDYHDFVQFEKFGFNTIYEEESQLC